MKSAGYGFGVGRLIGNERIPGYIRTLIGVSVVFPIGLAVDISAKSADDLPEPLKEWHQVVTFDAFPEGVVTWEEAGAPIAELVRVTRDEGWEGGREGGFATHVVTGNGAEGRMYHLATGGHGEAWGHVFAAIALEHPISARGAVYLQVAHQGGSNEYGIALAAEPVEPVDPPAATNPWGWTGPLAWCAEYFCVSDRTRCTHWNTTSG